MQSKLDTKHSHVLALTLAKKTQNLKMNVFPPEDASKLFRFS